jgi:hypothetical protein
MQPLWKSVRRFSKKLKIDLPYDLKKYKSCIYIHLKKHKSTHKRGTCTPIFIALRCTIAKLGDQSRCLTTDQWIKKMWYTYTMEYYSVIKNKIMSFEGNWMEMETIILSEINNVQKVKHLTFLLICGI